MQKVKGVKFNNKMKVGELKKTISNLPNNAEVYIQINNGTENIPANKADTKTIKTKDGQKHSFVTIVG